MITRRQVNAIFQGARGQKVLPGVVNRRRVGRDDELGALDSQAAAGLWKEIVVADREADGPIFQAKYRKCGAAPEVDLLQAEQRRGMDFAVLAGNLAGRSDQHRRVIVKA